MPKKVSPLSRTALARARRAGARVPRVSSAHYDRRTDAIIVEMLDGGFVGVPRAALTGALAEATPKQLGNVKIEGDRTYLFWPDLEDGLDIAYVLKRFVGVKPA